MKRNIVILIMLTFSVNCCYSQNNNSMPHSKNDKIYIVDRQEKGTIGCLELFVVEITDTLATHFSYVIKYHGDEITSITKYTKNVRTNQVMQGSFKLQNNSVLYHGGLFYNTQEFKKQHERPASLYSLIHPNFLELTNEEKIKILDSKVATRADTEQRK